MDSEAKQPIKLDEKLVIKESEATKLSEDIMSSERESFNRLSDTRMSDT